MMTRESHDSIADHYQQASLHLEAAAGHLEKLAAAEATNPIWLDDIEVNWRWMIAWSELCEQRAQAALSEETIHAPE